MSKDNKKNNRSKYFKWGLTAFLVIMASVLSIYTILNLSIISSKITGFLKMIMPVVDGLVVAYILSPLVDKIEQSIIYPICKKNDIEINQKRKGYIRLGSVLFTLLLVFALIIVFIRLVVPQLIDSIQNIINQTPVYMDSLINIANNILERFDIFTEKNVVSIVEHYYEDIMEFIQLNVVPRLNEYARSFSNSIFSFLGALFDLLIGFFIAVYLLISKEKFKAQTKKLIYALFNRERANLMVSDLRYIDRTFTSFIGGKIVDSIIIGLICFIILTCFAMPYTLLISVIIGLTNIIPFFGPFIGAIPSAILILLIDPVKAIYFVIIVIVLQQIDGNFIGPMILGNSTGLSGFWVIFSITVFGGIWGVPGMFLGVPTFACIYAWIKRRMNYALKKKQLSTDTSDYDKLDYINKDKKYVVKSNYIDLETDDNKKTKIKETKSKTNKENKLNVNVNKTKDVINNIIHKNVEEQSDTGVQPIDDTLIDDIIDENIE